MPVFHVAQFAWIRLCDATAQPAASYSWASRRCLPSRRLLPHPASTIKATMRRPFAVPDSLYQAPLQQKFQQQPQQHIGYSRSRSVSQSSGHHLQMEASQSGDQVPHPYSIFVLFILLLHLLCHCFSGAVRTAPPSQPSPHACG